MYLCKWVSLTTLQVSVGGQNVLQSTSFTLQYGYEHFLEQVNLAQQLTSSDFGISTGLINKKYWENSKWYYVNENVEIQQLKFYDIIIKYIKMLLTMGWRVVNTL
jgi:hypothetical protein